MTDGPIDLAQYRQERDDGGGRPPLRCPECGGQWFYLRTADGAQGQITFDTEGAVTGYYGLVVCAHDGAPVPHR